MNGGARHTGHAVKVKFYPILDKRPRTIDCACGWHGEYLPDRTFPDPDQPLLDGYAEHRRLSNAGPPKSADKGWERQSL